RPRATAELALAHDEFRDRLRDVERALDAGDAPQAQACIEVARRVPGHERALELAGPSRWLLARSARGTLRAPWVEHTLPGGEVSCIALSPEGTFALIGEHHSAVLWDLSTRERAATLDDHRGEVIAAALSRDARRLATGGRDGDVIVRDAGRDAPIFEIS